MHSADELWQHTGTSSLSEGASKLPDMALCLDAADSGSGRIARFERPATASPPAPLWRRGGGHTHVERIELFAARALRVHSCMPATWC